MPESPKLLATQSYGDGMRLIAIAAPKLSEEAVINQVAAELVQVADLDFKPKLVVDFTAVEYLASLFIGKLVALQKHVNESKGRVTFCCIRPSIMEIFKITRLDKVFAIYPDQKTAIKSFEGKLFGKN